MPYMSKREGEWQLPQRSVWPTRRVDLLEPNPVTNAAVADRTFKDAVRVGGTISELDGSESLAVGFTADEVDIVIDILGTPYTRQIRRDWRLTVDGKTYQVKRVDRPDQYKIRVFAQRFGK